MTKQWNELSALARQIAESIAAGQTVDAEKAWRLARAVLAIDSDKAVTRSSYRAGGEHHERR